MSTDKQDNQSPKEQKKDGLKLAINEIQPEQAVGTCASSSCASATYSFDVNDVFKKMTETPQIMARVSPYDANASDKTPVKKADIERIKRVFGF
jgi:hypothetical protein